MKKLFVTLLTLIVPWVILSIVMMWPPICRYMGESGSSCLSHLFQIQGAKEQYILETGRTNGVIDPAAVAKYLIGGREPRCLSGGIYNFGNFGEEPSCSLGNGPVPRPRKERVSLVGWKWKVWPSTPQSHRLPDRAKKPQEP